MSHLKTLIRTHAEWILVGAGLILVVALVWVLVWGIAIQAHYLGSSLAAPKSQNIGDKFNLEQAAGLNLRGLEE